MHSLTCVLPPPGSRASHCGACHETFGTVHLFDSHRVGNTDTRRCLVPGYDELSYLVEDDHGVWQTPEGLEYRTHLAARLAEGRRKS